MECNIISLKLRIKRVYIDITHYNTITIIKAKIGNHMQVFKKLARAMLLVTCIHLQTMDKISHFLSALCMNSHLQVLKNLK